MSSEHRRAKSEGGGAEAMSVLDSTLVSQALNTVFSSIAWYYVRL